MPECLIAGIKMNIEYHHPDVLKRLDSFMNNNGQSDIHIEALKTDMIFPPEEEIMIEDDTMTWLRHKDSQGYTLYHKEKSNDKINTLMNVDKGWERAVISYLSDDLSYQYNPFFLAGIVFRNYLIHHEGIVIHASSLAYKNKGILFAAPSGTGKSTHVSLWESCFGTGIKVINDDTPAIRNIDGQLHLFGTPWSGSSNKFLNESAPLSAIVILEQSPQNTIKKLSLNASLPLIMPRLFLPFFDGRMMEKAYTLLSKMLLSIPIYLLKCRPDEESVSLAYKAIY